MGIFLPDLIVGGCTLRRLLFDCDFSRLFAMNPPVLPRVDDASVIAVSALFSRPCLPMDNRLPLGLTLVTPATIFSVLAFSVVSGSIDTYSGVQIRGQHSFQMQVHSLSLPN